ncbi:DUF1236 domain-containing protein [Bradyrhizobium sp. Leo121]|uniref:DUF1236 domain-containing protein n=1 Tax=Bradyrhizobium sp. Leo121 TaxID=1571195 RepID=UPI0010299CE4|nr:DUF1236 domain-containing protein [Bradyrhizobium sp. Leo121]RZN18513.1 hypothetical protein CWO90_36205 [Bradyrhizobium sp. Leo121]
MTNRLLISVATAALIAGTGFANAQGTGMSRESPSGGGATTQHSAPSSGGASSGTMNREHGGTTGMNGAEQSGKSSGSSGMKSESDRSGAADRNAQDTNAPGQKSKSMNSENERTKGEKDMKAEGREGRDRDRMNAETRDKSGGTAAESRDKSGTMEKQKGATDTSRSQTTTGNAGTSATAAPPAEKRTQIVSAIKSERVEEVKNVNFNVAVGTTVPTSVRFHPLPSRIVEIYPEWRGYDFILVNGRYVIVQPETHQIVYIIEG